MKSYKKLHNTSKNEALHLDNEDIPQNIGSFAFMKVSTHLLVEVTII
ncbi:MAG: hypothetical protein NTW92_09625 [Bacteroidetes bacterium]|nr:hypothetical protein [Bacteroidota bacterium]